jgi:5-methylcytosine-specific restriction endonuclease McrA
MAIGYGVACPKGEPLKKTRRRAKRQDRTALKAWRDFAWSQQPGALDLPQWGFCATCDALVSRAGWRRGHVHHKISRRHKATRTDPSNAQILCRKCHNKVHGREF